MTRDPVYIGEFLDQVAREAERRFGIHAESYRARVEARLELGAERYGDDDFLRKDMVCELLEETPDVASHAVLEAQKRLASGLEVDAELFHLFEAAVHGAAADWHALQARTRD